MIPPRLLYAAVGSLAYGGSLHALMAGSVFAGAGYVDSATLTRCGNVVLMARRRGSRVWAELYYVEASLLRRIDAELSAYGAVRKTVTVKVNGFNLMAETHQAGCETVEQGEAISPYRRLLLALPAGVPPPIQPLAAFTAIVEGVKHCGNVFCVEEGVETEAAIADIYISPERLEEWFNSLGARKSAALARTSTGLRLYVHMPVGETR